MTSISMTEHRLEGLEPDNLLAFLALLGLLRALESARPDWRPRVRWSLDEPPLRPVLVLPNTFDRATICAAVTEGVAELARSHEFGGKVDLNHSAEEARAFLRHSRTDGGYTADLATALLSDSAVKMDQGKPQDVIEATPLCLLFGQGHQHFLDRLAIVPKQAAPSPRGSGRGKGQITAEECLAEALFSAWVRQDSTFSFRWDTAEDVRYALMFGDPSKSKNKEGTQHGANRLAAIGLSIVTAVPVLRDHEVRLNIPCGIWKRGFAFAWPIWRPAVSLNVIRALMFHPNLRKPDGLTQLGVDHIRKARRISVGKFMNFTRARAAGN